MPPADNRNPTAVTHGKTKHVRRMRVAVTVSRPLAGVAGPLERPWPPPIGACDFWCWRGFALESAAARVCKETRAWYHSTCESVIFELPPRCAHDHRRLEVVAGGLPLIHRVQLVIDTTMVSLVRPTVRKRGRGLFFLLREGKMNSLHHPITTLQQATRRSPTRTHDSQAPQTAGTLHGVAKEVAKTVTPTGSTRQRQGKPQTTEEQHAEELGQKRKMGEEGTAVHGSPDMDPDCDLRRPCSLGKRGQVALEEKSSSTARVAKNCQP